MHNPHIIFSLGGSGSHLYSAHTNTVRSRTLSSRSYSPLVGLATPLLPCIPHLHPYYITRMGICQEVFYIFFESPDFITTIALWWLLGCLTSPLDTLIISQVFQLVKGFLKNILELFLKGSTDFLVHPWECPSDCPQRRYTNHCVMRWHYHKDKNRPQKDSA